jgi:hypothetical protein
MKPAPQISSNHRSSRTEQDPQRSARSLPVVDCSYQMTTAAVETPAPVVEQQVTQLPNFRSLSREVFASKTDGEYIKEAIFFGWIAFAAAWPVSVMLYQLATMMISPPPGGIW